MPKLPSRSRRANDRMIDRSGQAATPITIRCARPGDVSCIAPLFDAYRQFYGARSNVEKARRFLFARLVRRESVVFIASLPSTERVSRDVVDPPYGDAIGFTQLYPSFSSLALGPIIVLNDLFVSPEWRRVHVARRLVKEAVGYAVRLEAARVALSTQHTNTAALRLYTSLGFTEDAAFAHLSLEL